jgi:hypothetical protein
VHRDIKPENILVDQSGLVHIADFGLARLIDPDGRHLTLTSQRQRVGTPHYMAPEQIEAPDLVDQRADLFAVGVVLYEMLTGSLPLGRFDPPSRTVSVAQRVNAIVMRSLERDPSRRYQSARALQDDLERTAREGIEGWRPGWPRAASDRRPPRRQDRVALMPEPSGPPPRLSWLAMAAMLWFGAAWMLAFIKWCMALAARTDRASPPSPAASGGIAVMAVSWLCAIGIVAGPVLGYFAWKRIKASGGRLYGRRPAMIAMLGPVFWIFDWLTLLFLQVNLRNVDPLSLIAMTFGLMYLNYWFVARRTRQVRPIRRR